MSNVEFDTPANRIISQLAPKNQFGIDTSLPDIAFLRQMSVQGRMRYLSTSASVDSGEIANSFTPANGETFFLLSIYLTLSRSAQTIATCQIENDGQTRQLVRLLNNVFVKIDMIDSLVGDGTKAITIVAGNDNESIRSTIIGWVENTSRIRDVTT